MTVKVFAADEASASLFFTAEEVQRIRLLESKAPVAAEAGDIHLGAVFYYAPDNWVLWLQGMRWTPETKNPDLQVLSVTPDEVQLRVAHAGAAAEEIVLKPHQTYRLSAGSVVEGASVEVEPDLSK